MSLITTCHDLSDTTQLTVSYLPKSQRFYIEDLTCDRHIDIAGNIKEMEQMIGAMSRALNQAKAICSTVKKFQ